MRCALAFCLSACALVGSPGAIEQPTADTSFVREPLALLVEGHDGLVRISLDGRGREELFPPRYLVLDVSSDGREALLTDGAGRLFVGDLERREARWVTALERRLVDAAFSPDGASIAAVRTGDPLAVLPAARPGDEVLVVDVATLEPRFFPASRSTVPARVAFSADGASVYLEGSDGQRQWLEISSGARQVIEEAPAPSALRVRPNHRADTVCPENGASLVTGDFGIDLIQGAERRRLVGIAGRARATRDLSPTIGQAFFAPRCAYVVFVHDQYVHVVEVATGRVARLLPGWRAYFSP